MFEKKSGMARPTALLISLVFAHGDVTKRAKVGQPLRPIITFGISPTDS
jgi:hypothetical protein